MDFGHYFIIASVHIPKLLKKERRLIMPSTALKAWNDSYSVGVNKLDGDHQKILTMINKLHEAMAAGQSKDVMKTLISDLKSYSLSHFTNEETYLETIDYPDLAEQKQQHAIFINKIKEFETEMMNGNLLLAMKVMPFLNDWLLSHIMNKDMKYSKH